MSEVTCFLGVQSRGFALITVRHANAQVGLYIVFPHPMRPWPSARTEVVSRLRKRVVVTEECHMVGGAEDSCRPMIPAMYVLGRSEGVVADFQVHVQSRRGYNYLSNEHRRC